MILDAAFRGDLERIIHLVNNEGISVNTCHFRVSEEGEEVVQQETNFLTKYQTTALHFAAMGGYTKVCHWLIRNGANVNAKNEVSEWRTRKKLMN